MPYTNLRNRSSLLNKRPVELSSLPSHVLQRTRRYFSDPTPETRELSKDWTSVNEYPFIWTNLVFRGNKASTDTICNILQNAPMLESLELHKVPEVETVLRQLCRSKHQLKHLSVRFCHSSEDIEYMVSIPEATLRHVIQSCPLLVSLDIEGTPFYGKLFYEELIFLRRLRSLRIGCNVLLRPRDIQAVASACRGRLTHFCISQCQGKPPRPVRIFSPGLSMSHNAQQAEVRALQELTKPTSTGPLTSADCALLLRMLGPKLSVLELDAGGVELWALQGLLGDCPGLRCLCLLNAKNISGELVRGISQAMPRLTHLVLRGAPLVGDGDLLGFLERGGVGYGAVAEEAPPDPEGDAAEETAADPVKEWWEWGFWSDQEEDYDSGEEETTSTNSDPKSEFEEEGEEWGKTTSAKVGMHTLDVGMCPFIGDGLLCALAQSPTASRLRRLGLRGCQLVTEEGLAFLNSCIGLRHLDVSFINGGKGPSPDWLESVGSQLPALKTLVIGWQRRSEDRGEMTSALEKLTKNGKSLRVKRRLSCYHGRLVAIH